MRFVTIFITLLFCTVLGARAQHMETITYENNTITMLYDIDSLYVINPETGEESLVFSRREKVDKLNNNTIYYGDEASEPVGAASQKDLQSFIKGVLGDELVKSGLHNFNVIVDEKGNVAYVHITPYSIKDMIAIRDNLTKALKDTRFFPAQKDGKPVPYAVRINK